MIASHLSATLALMFINADSTHGTASAAAAIGNDTSQNVGGRFSSVAAVNDHVGCVDDEQAHDNKLFLRHNSKTGKSKKTSKSSKSRRGKSVKKCPPTDTPTASPIKEPAASTAPPTGAPQATTATPGPTPAFIESTLAPSPSKVEALSRSIWGEASEDFTFDFFGIQSTCNWKEFDACVQHPTLRGGSNEAYDACEKAMLKAFGDPRLTADVESYLLFNTNLTSGIVPETMTGCTSLVSASREIYPDSEALATARSDFADTTVGAPGTPTLKSTAAPTAFIESTLAPSPSKVEALSRSIWGEASEDFTFDFFGIQSTCNWKEFDACVQHPTLRGGSNEAYDACEKAMLKAFGDPRLTADVESYLLFNTNLTSGIVPETMTGCTSLVSASREIYPDSEALATARSDFADTTVGAPGTPTLKSTAAPTNPSDGGDCTLRQQSATMLTEDVCLKSQTIGSESCPECPSSCDSFGSGSEFSLETGKFYIFEVNRQKYPQRNGIWFNLVHLQSPNSYMSLYKGTFCDGLTCISSRDGGGCPGMQERELDNGLYVLFIHGAEDDATFDLEFTFTSYGSPYPSVCSV